MLPLNLLNKVHYQVAFMLILCHNYFRVPSNNKNKDVNPHYSRKKYAVGVVVLFAVVVLWILSSELTMKLYKDKKLERPFLISYVRSSLLFIYLLVLCFTPPTRDPCRPTDYTQLLEPTTETDDENCNEVNNSLGDSTFVPVRAGENTDSDDPAPRAVRFNKVAEVRVMSAAMAGEALLARLSWAASVRATQHAQQRAAAAATRRHLRRAALFCIPWFLSHYLYRLSLLHTTHSSSANIYASTTGAFALCIGAVFAQTTNDRFSVSKCVAVLLTAAGLVVLALSESHQSNWTAVLGALGSAVCYAIHLLMFQRELRKGDGINCPLLIGLIGCACACFAWPLGAALSVWGVEKADFPPAGQWSWLLIDACIGPLLMESLWLWGRSLTSSRTATRMLGLILPLSACLEVALTGGGAGRAFAGMLAGAGWVFAATELPTEKFSWITARLRSDKFAAVRNIPELDEQSEALMSPDEPT